MAQRKEICMLLACGTMLTTYNPDRDQDEKTWRVGLRIIELLAECASFGI